MSDLNKYHDGLSPAIACLGRKKAPMGKKGQPPLPDDFDHRFPAPFGESIREWLTYKAERKDFYTPTGLRNLLTQLYNRSRRHSAESITELISECMANNWAGIIWDRIERQSARPYGNNRRSANRVQPELGNIWSELIRAEQIGHR